MSNLPTLVQTSDYAYFVINNKPAFNGKKWLKALKFHTEGLAPVCDETGWYHINLQGQPAYDERYDRVFGYYFGRSAVIINNNWYHIDTQGNRVYKQNYAWCGNYQEKLCTVRDFDGNYYHIDLQGNRIYEENYRYAGDFKDGYAAVRLESGFYKHIDKKGKDLNGKLFVDLGVFHKSFATAKDDKGWHHIDLDGNELYPERYAMIEPFYNGFALVETFDNKKQIIDETGKLCIVL